MKRIHCFFSGHCYGPLDMLFCERCGHEYEYGEPIGVFGGIAFRWRYTFRPWIRRKLAWFRKCEDCGKRFGRHDETVDHLPF